MIIFSTYHLKSSEFRVNWFLFWKSFVLCLLPFFFLCTYCTSRDPILVENPASSLVAAYLFNSDEATKALDSGPNKLDGQIKSPRRVTGYFGGALEFNDSTDYVYVEHYEVLNLDRFTLMAWVKPFSWGSAHRRMEIIEKTDAYWLNIRRDTGKLRCGGVFMWDAYPSLYYLDSDQPVPLNEWSHTASTWDGDSLRIFLNGRKVGSINVRGNAYHTQNSLTIGAKMSINQSVVAVFHGIIDEVRIYSRALTQDEILHCMNSSNLGPF